MKPVRRFSVATVAPCVLPVEPAPAEELLPAGCTFGEACERISRSAPDEAIWVLQAPGHVAFLGPAQLAAINHLPENCVLCLAAFYKNASENTWSLHKPASIHQFTWIGFKSSLLRGLHCDSRICDSYSSTSFAHALRKHARFELMNPCFSFAVLRTTAPLPVPRFDSRAEAVDIVLEQQYNPDAKQTCLRAILEMDESADVPTLRIRTAAHFKVEKKTPTYYFPL